jgi:hypothetical protein
VDPQPGMQLQQAALARAGQLTTELIELVRRLRVAVTEDEPRPAHEARQASGRLQSGELRTALSHTNRRSTRQVPHLFG